METLAVIPARGGSVRIPRKNMRDLGGKPLVQWTIEAAQASDATRVVVSTEDPEIAALAIRLGVEVVPQPLTSAMSGTMSAPVVAATLDFMAAAHDYRPHIVALLHPTSPFRGPEHINAAIKMAGERAESVISFTGDELNGALYVTTVGRFSKRGTFFSNPIRPLELDARAGLDIDTWDDLERAREAIK